MSRSSSWRPRRNKSIPTARPGVPCSQLRDNLIASGEQGGSSADNGVPPEDARSRRELAEPEELEAIVFFRVPRGRPRHQQGDVAGDLMLHEEGPGPIAPIFRILSQ